MAEESNTEQSPRRVRVMPPVYLLAAIIAMAALHAHLPGVTVLPAPWRWLGVAPLIGGVVLGGLAVRLFGKYQTTIKPGEISCRLMTDGPFRFSRNPIYLGMTNILAGVAAMLGSLTPWFVLPVFIGLIARNVIPVEEAIMAETFGSEYQEYRARVRRWI